MTEREENFEFADAKIRVRIPDPAKKVRLERVFPGEESKRFEDLFIVKSVTPSGDTRYDITIYDQNNKNHILLNSIWISKKC